MIVYDLKTKQIEIIEESNEIIEEMVETATLPPTPEERIEALEMALLELAEVMCNG